MVRFGCDCWKGFEKRHGIEPCSPASPDPEAGTAALALGCRPSRYRFLRRAASVVLAVEMSGFHWGQGGCLLNEVANYRKMAFVLAQSQTWRVCGDGGAGYRVGRKRREATSNVVTAMAVVWVMSIVRAST